MRLIPTLVVAAAVFALATLSALAQDETRDEPKAEPAAAQAPAQQPPAAPEPSREEL